MRVLGNLLWAAFWFALFSVPVALLFADPSATLPPGPMANLYGDAVAVLGEVGARVVFCGTWLAIDTALFWHYVVRRDRSSLESEPPDLHD
jgi:hypothetical protein